MPAGVGRAPVPLLWVASLLALGEMPLRTSVASPRTVSHMRCFEALKCIARLILVPPVWRGGILNSGFVGG